MIETIGGGLVIFAQATAAASAESLEIAKGLFFFQIGEASAVALRELADLVEDLCPAGRRVDLERIALEAYRIFYLPGAFGDQGYARLVQPVEVPARLGQRGG